MNFKIYFTGYTTCRFPIGYNTLLAGLKFANSHKEFFGKTTVEETTVQGLCNDSGNVTFSTSMCKVPWHLARTIAKFAEQNVIYVELKENTLKKYAKETYNIDADTPAVHISYEFDNIDFIEDWIHKGCPDSM